MGNICPRQCGLGLNQRISLLCVHTLVLEKEYTYDAFWTILLSCGWRICWSASSKSWPSQCPRSCSGTPGVRWKSYEDLQADLQLQASLVIPHCSLLNFFGFFWKKYIWQYLPCFSFVLPIYSLTDQYGCGVYIKTRIFRKKSLMPPPLSPIGICLKKYIFFKKVIFST